MIESFAGIQPTIDASAYVHPAAVVIGDVQIGAATSVWPNATLRGDDAPIVIGAQTSIQDGVTVHATEGESRTIVGSRVTVGHNALLHGCTIASDCLIGMGSILLDGCVVEPWAFVGAGTLVPPGKVVRAGTLVMGNPMRVVRHCTDKDREWIVHSWNAYVRRMGEYRARDQERARGDERDGG